jgi:hypothetical protein
LQRRDKNLETKPEKEQNGQPIYHGRRVHSLILLCQNCECQWDSTTIALVKTQNAADCCAAFHLTKVLQRTSSFAVRIMLSRMA